MTDRQTGSIRATGLITLTWLLLKAMPASATVFITVDEALKLAFPDCEVERTTVYLTKEQIAQAEKLSGYEIPSAIVHPYVARHDGKVVGIAYFDAHVVRTLPETIMIVVGPDDSVQRIEVLSFNEPQDYIPGDIWYQQFIGQKLTDALAVKRNIRHIIGATLTARVTTEAVRRVLAIHHTLRDSFNP